MSQQTEKMPSMIQPAGQPETSFIKDGSLLFGLAGGESEDDEYNDDED